MALLSSHPRSYTTLQDIIWYSRYVISWTLDETLELGFVLDAIAQARTVATPEIWNTDSG